MCAVIWKAVRSRRAVKPWLDGLMVSAIVVLVHVLPTLVAMLRVGLPRLETITRSQAVYDLGAAVATPIVAALIAWLIRRTAMSSVEA